MTQAFNLSQLANNLNSSGQLDGSDGLFNAVPPANGGTGLTTLGAAGNMLIATDPSTLAAVTMPTFGFKNRIINGAMMIDQRNAGASVTPTAGAYTLDRYTANLAQASKLTIQQSSTAPTGFINSLLVTSSSAYSVLTGDYFNIQQNIEGLNIADLAWGTANAAPVTLSFWVRSSLTGAFGGSLRNNASDRSYPFTYTINSANTWEQKIITIAGDTSGTWLTTNGIGIKVGFSLGAGATYSGTASAWAGANYFQPTGATSVVGTNGATFYITGVQLEKGSTATSFDYRPYGTELALCQRYCPVFDASTGTGARILGYGRSTTSTDVSFEFPVTLRTPPTGITVSSASNFNIFNPANGGSGAVTALTFSLGDIQGSILSATTTVATPTIAGGSLLQMYPNSTSAKIIFNGCEL
jgi:hypothetical protein